jgi:hypothetical protein
MKSVPPSAMATRPFWSECAIGEGSTRVAEQLILEEMIREGGRVHRDEGVRAAGAQVMDRSRAQLLPRPRLTADQDGEGRRGHERQLADDADEPGVVADETGHAQLPGQAGREGVVGLLSRTQAQEPTDALVPFVGPNGPEDEVVDRRHGGA